MYLDEEAFLQTAVNGSHKGTYNEIYCFINVKLILTTQIHTLHSFSCELSIKKILHLITLLH